MKRLLSIIFALICIFSFALLCFAHPGRTDANGGHYNRKTGEYHYHNGNSGYSDYLYDSETTTRKSFDEIMSERDETKKLNEENYQKGVGESFSEYTDKLLDSKNEENTGESENTQSNTHFLWPIAISLFTILILIFIICGVYYRKRIKSMGDIIKKNNKKSLLSDLAIILSIWGPLLFIIIGGSAWKIGSFDGTTMEQLFPALFIGFVVAFFTIILVSNIFKKNTLIWWISAIVAFVVTVIIYMLSTQL